MNYEKKIKVRITKDSPYNEYGNYKIGDIGEVVGYTNGCAVIILENGKFAKAELDWIEEIKKEGLTSQQPRQEWSEDDNNILNQRGWDIVDFNCLNTCKRAIEAYKKIEEKKYGMLLHYYEEALRWLDSLEIRIQPKKEWSEENEKAYDILLNYFYQLSEGRCTTLKAWEVEAIRRLLQGIYYEIKNTKRNKL